MPTGPAPTMVMGTSSMGGDGPGMVILVMVIMELDYLSNRVDIWACLLCGCRQNKNE